MPVLLADEAGQLPSGTVDDNFAIFGARLKATIARLEAAGRKVRRPRSDSGDRLVRPRRTGYSLMYDRLGPPPPSAAEVARRLARVDQVFRTLAQEGAITYLPVASQFCDVTCDIVNAKGKPLYWDGDHLSRTGSLERITPVLSAGLWPANSATANRSLGPLP